MKLSLTALLIITLVGSLVAGLQDVKVAEGNFLPVASVNYIWSPENKTYGFNVLTLNVSVSYFVTSAEDRWIAYSIDGGENVTLTGTEYLIDLCWKGINITAPLPKLSEGSHRLDVYAQFSNPINFSTPHSRTVFFTIDSTIPTPPSTSNLTPAQSPKTIVAITPTAISSTLPVSSPALIMTSTNLSTQQPTLSPEPTGTNEFPTWTILLLTLVMALMAAMIIKKKKLNN